LFRRHFEGIGFDRDTGMRRRSQAKDMRGQGDVSVVGIGGGMVDGYPDGHDVEFTCIWGSNRLALLKIAKKGEWVFNFFFRG